MVIRVLSGLGGIVISEVFVAALRGNWEKGWVRGVDDSRSYRFFRCIHICHVK